jgi:hypothetical protein
LFLLVVPAGGRNLRALAEAAVEKPQALRKEKPESVFKGLAEELAQRRLSGAEESETLQEQALGILDNLVLEALNNGSEPNLDILNQRLAELVTQHPPVGEDYQVVRLGVNPGVYALVANFGLAGPSAVRLYRGSARDYTLAGRIDRFARKDFFDEYLKLVPVAAPVILFVTVTGRTDELQTGVFIAWRFDAHLQAAWSSDILQQSSYESGADGFRLTYCSETEADNPRACRRMTRDRYVWQGAAWKRVEQTPLPVPKR